MDTKTSEYAYHAAIYVRLSKEDGDKPESDSIGNQKDLIRAYLAGQPDIDLCSERVDDGYTGVNFQRPDFTAMMKDVREKKINCIVVKDFSRLGRNFIETGKYIEKIFPFMGVRFISVNDGYDSLNPKTSSDNLIVPVKNLMNDAYCRDISIKIRSQLDIKRKKGDFIAPFAVYGYLKDSENKNKLIVDEFAAAVVQDIFKFKLDGMSAQAIADRLNEQDILSPLEYKNLIGLKYKTTFKANPKAKWTAAAILRILKNPIYVGTLVQGKRSSPNYKVKKRFDKPADQWISIENNHEPIIDKEAFHDVAKILRSDTRTAPSEETVYPLAGLIYCGDCGKSMVRKNNASSKKPYIYYVCSGCKSGSGCTSHSIRDILLEQAVLVALQEHIRAILDIAQTLDDIKNLPYTSRQVKKADERLAAKRKELAKYQNNKMKLHEDYADGIISREDFVAFGKRYDKKSDEAEAAILCIEKEIDELTSGKSAGQQWIGYFSRHGNVEGLSRKLAVQLIDRISVYENQKIHIQFKFQHEYDSTIAFLEAVKKSGQPTAATAPRQGVM